MNRSFRRIFCLNLARSPERWANAAAELERFGIEVERVEAVDGQTLRFEDLVAEGLLSATYCHAHSPGAFGVIATHVALWKRIAAAESGWYLILEDDVRLHPALMSDGVWDTYWQSVPADAEFVYLGCSSPWLNGPADDEATLLRYSTPMNRFCVRVQKTIQGTYAYAITPFAARVLLARYLPLATPLDYFPPTLFPFYALRRVTAPSSDSTAPGFYQTSELWNGQATVQLHGVVGVYPFPSTVGHGATIETTGPPARPRTADGEEQVLAGVVRQLQRFARNPQDWRALYEAGSSCRHADRHALGYLFLDAALHEARRRAPADSAEEWARDFSCRDDLAVSAFYAAGSAGKEVGVAALRDLFSACMRSPRGRAALRLDGARLRDNARCFGDSPLAPDAECWLAAGVEREPSIAIVCDAGAHGEEWDPDRVRLKGSGGSEEAAVYVAESLARLGHRVVVYGNPPADTLHGFPTSNPRFVERHRFAEHIAVRGARRFEALVVWRYPGAVADLARSADKTLLWMHDIYPGSAFAGVPLEQLAAVLWLSRFQYEAAGGAATVPLSLCHFTANGIVPEQFADLEGIRRHPYRCIYASNYMRGLEVLLRCWPKVKARVPQATLDIYYGWQTWLKMPLGWEAMMRQLLAEVAPLGVREHGRIGHEALARELGAAGFWTYPCTAAETFCITGLKAQMAGCIPVYVAQGGLRETVADGFHCDTPEQYADLLIEALSHADDEARLAPMRSRLRTAAGEHSWDRIAASWLAHLSAAPARRGASDAKPIRIQLLANWTTSRDLRRLWSKMTRGNNRWGRIVVTEDGRDVDFYAVFNAPPPEAHFVPERTIVFQLEPRRALAALPEPWCRPDPARFFHVRSRDRFSSICEWHLGTTYDELSSLAIVKTRVLSSVTSSLYIYPGHRKRVDFIRYLERRGTRIDIFGKTNDAGFEHYRGPLPLYQKEAGLFPYKYTFAAENHAEVNYVTEKLVDAILSECLCFYWGCPNLADFVDGRAFIAVDLDDFAGAARTIEAAIEAEEWERRIDAIRRAKRRILDEDQLFPTLERIVSGGAPAPQSNGPG